jgi:predicted N-acetyltransferase YhbS/SAM-dependent methyltransferase
MQIRTARHQDAASIRTIHLTAFDTSCEADLVEALREHAKPFLSLVADDGGIVGHVAFSPVIHQTEPTLRLAGLGPLAVLPTHQRRGVGRALVDAGLDECRRQGFHGVVVLGDPSYYMRFGFLPASHWEMRSEYDGADDAFMAVELEPGALLGSAGTVRYHPAFAAASGGVEAGAHDASASQPVSPVMDRWKFFDIIHREHILMNPTNDDKIDRLVALLRLHPGDRAVDFGCGKGEFLFRLTRNWSVTATGIDISSFAIADARRRWAQTRPSTDVTFTQADGAKVPVPAGSVALAACIGATWIFGGYRSTLTQLAGMVHSDGWVVVGEPFWIREPSQEYLAAAGLQRDTFGTHAENAESHASIGLRLVHTLVSSPDDWDRYEALQWYAADTYARAHPEDSDVSELLQRVAKHRDAFLRWGRDTLGWAIYVFRPDKALAQLTA